MTSCLLPWTTNPSKMGSTLNGKNILLGSKFFSLRVDPIQNEGKSENGLVVSSGNKSTAGTAWWPPLRLHQGKWPSLIFARRPVMLYICTKFCKIIWNDIKVIEWTWFLYWKLQRGIILQKDTISKLTIYKITKGHSRSWTVSKL